MESNNLNTNNKIQNDSEQSQNIENQETLKSTLDKVLEMLKKNIKSKEEQVENHLYQYPPFIKKELWTNLGNQISKREKATSYNVPGDKFFTLRLDGNGFSKLLKTLRKKQIFQNGFSLDFAEIQRKCLTSLMLKFNAKFGYTQSDEMTIIIRPAGIVKGEQTPHPRNGRVLKICTLAASYVTAIFNQEIYKIIINKNLKIEDFEVSDLPTFDCRLGIFDTEEEAFSLILWRAYDSGVNGVSDAVHQNKFLNKGNGNNDKGKVIEMDKFRKLLWLREKDLLPLPKHQAYGSFFQKVKRVREGPDRNPNLKEERIVKFCREVIEESEGNILKLYCEGNLFKEDEKLEG